MPRERFDIVFAGALMEGAVPAEVQARVGRLFKVGGERLRRLFSGRPVRIKQGVDADTAAHYRRVLREAGALVEIRPVADAGPGDTLAGAGLAPPRSGSLEDCAPPVAPAPLPDLSGMELAPAGTPIDTSPPPPPPQIDISALSAAPPNSGDLSDCVPPARTRPLPDISGLALEGDQP